MTDPPSRPARWVESPPESVAVTSERLAQNDSPQQSHGAATWSPEVLESLSKNLLPYVDRYLQLRERELAHDATTSRAEARWQLQTTLTLLGFAAAVIVAMSVLTVLDKVSGDALLFLVGTAVGAVFSMVHQQFARPREIAVVSEE